jgi:FHS family L-fucose permease-like MFS transporter
MSEENKGGNIFAIATMFALFFMIAFVTNFASPMGVIAKNQFNASNALSQLGNAANFIAYLFMGIPGGLILKRKGYKFTALIAVAIGFIGVGIQLLSGYVSSFAVYVAGAFVAGFSMCLLNLVVNPLLNTLGGGGNKGNQLVQFGCSLNSVGGTIAPVLLGYLIGGEVAKAKVMDAAPALMTAMGIFAVAFVVVALSKIPELHIETAEEKEARLSGKTSIIKDIATTLKFRHFILGAVGIFFYIVIEVGIPAMGLNYMTEQIKAADGTLTNGPGYVGAVVAGSVAAAYWFLMMIGRILGGVLGAKVSSRAMITGCSSIAIALLATVIFMPVTMVNVPGLTAKIPLAMCLMAACGLCTSVMWGGIFNMATEGLGKYVPIASGIFMAMVSGGMLIPVQGLLADVVGILNSYWMTIGLLAYLLFYALVGSKLARPDIKVD